MLRQPIDKEHAMHDIFDQLEAEWAVFNRRRDVRRFMANLAEHPLFEPSTPERLIREIREVGKHDHDRCDDMYAVLVALAATDPIPHRIVLQAVRPGLCNLARRLQATRSRCQSEEITGDLVAYASVNISTYPLEARPRRIAANICLDALKHFHKHRRKASVEIPVEAGADNDDVALAAKADPRGSQAFKDVENRLDLVTMIRHACEIGLLPERERTLIVTTRLRDADTDEVAAMLELSEDVVRKARFRAERRLARRFAHAGPAFLAA